jgi:hypothetical protein
VLGQGSLCDSVDSVFQFGESLCALKELLENRGSPASTDDARGGFYGAKFWALDHVGPGSILYTTYRMRVTYTHVTMLTHSSSILTTAISGLAL